VDLNGRSESRSARIRTYSVALDRGGGSSEVELGLVTAFYTPLLDRALLADCGDFPLAPPWGMPLPKGIDKACSPYSCCPSSPRIRREKRIPTHPLH